MKTLRLLSLPLLTGLSLPLFALRDQEIKYDHYLGSKWNTVSMGVYTTEYAPVLRIKSGEIVKIDTSSSAAGVGVRGDIEKYYKDNNLPTDTPLAQDSIEINAKTKPHPGGLRGALLTGPIYIEGAMPGDSIEVRVLDVRF